MLIFWSLQSCSKGGGGGDGVVEEPQVPNSAQQDYDDAIAALRRLDIKGAQSLFSASMEKTDDTEKSLSHIKSDVDLTSIIPQSQFGHALTNLILLMESQPVSDLLAAFGQSSWSVDSIFGDDGYIAETNKIFGADSVDLTLSGDTISTMHDDAPIGRAWSYTDPQNAVTTFNINYSDPVTRQGFDFVGTLTTVWPLTVLSGACTVSDGQTIPLGSKCTTQDQNSTPYERPTFELFLRTPDHEYFSNREAGTGGSITINSLGGSPGETLSITFNDAKLVSASNHTITLNGTYVDKVSDQLFPQIQGLGIPFADSCHDKPHACILGKVESGYRSSNFVQTAQQLISPLEEIIAEMSLVTSNANASFEIPRELFAGVHDMHVSHSDMLMMLGSLSLVKAGLRLMDSWNCDVTLSGLFDQDGHFIGDKQVLVDELNECFALSQNNHLADARNDFSEGLSYLKEGLDEVLAGSSSGMIVFNQDDQQLLAESKTMVASALSAMGGSTAISGLTPIVNVNLENLFNGSVDGSMIQSDPFVLQGGNIELVEAYFSQLMQNVCSYDLVGSPKVEVFSAAVRSKMPKLLHKVFQNVTVYNTFGGRLIQSF
jgi:hypothetical protein